MLGRSARLGGRAGDALSMARKLADPEGEAYALLWLGLAALYAHDTESGRAWLLEAQRLDPAAIPGWVLRGCAILLAIALIDAGETADAQRYCADALAMARQAGPLFDQGEALRVTADLDIVADRVPGARAHLRQAIELCSRIGYGVVLIDCLDSCGYLCAATGRWAEAITMWAACTSALRAAGMQANLATATQYALLLVSEQPGEAAGMADLPRLSARERELVTLLGHGRTNAEIAAQLFISARAVRSHLDRIRDKTGCRRRADLTRLALRAGLV
jgi:DNA-binding CsgD family transcriptional regulator